ncbi:hypothetical protein EJ08DRAFT_735216 [Tothia fuscella]|uniref:Uncharacterized protein n=1 Tax=Tothia fuscella TaxID=1048955 RepID=A0A9P4TWG9_9PEZI|nr:hypothetical protein EJ08DRAFT_735216 [Tothia fuscella]
MKLTSFSLAIAAVALTGTTIADNCYGPYNWCGWDLIKRGNYKDYIKGKLADAGKPTDDRTIQNSLWQCTNDKTGDADFITVCAGNCIYGGGPNTDDHC